VNKSLSWRFARDINAHRSELARSTLTKKANNRILDYVAIYIRLMDPIDVTRSRFAVMSQVVRCLFPSSNHARQFIAIYSQSYSSTLTVLRPTFSSHTCASKFYFIFMVALSIAKSTTLRVPVSRLYSSSRVRRRTASHFP